MTTATQTAHTFRSGAATLPAISPARPNRIVRRSLSQRLELAGVLSLLLSSGVYGLYALLFLAR